MANFIELQEVINGHIHNVSVNVNHIVSYGQGHGTMSQLTRLRLSGGFDIHVKESKAVVATQIKDAK